MIHGDNLIKNKLIIFFAEFKFDDIDTDDAKNRLFNLFDVNNREELKNCQIYNQYFLIIYQLRKNLDDTISGLDKIEQVQSILALLNREREVKEIGKMEILKLLIKNEEVYCIYKSWDNEQKKHYDSYLPLVTRWNDFFFSYTNRNLTEINNDFSELITHSLGKKDFSDNKNKTNCLAKLIVRQLDMKNLYTFFDKDNIVCGDIIEDEILNHCKECYVFIQLVEKATFHISDNMDNWCYREFKEFDNWIKTNNSKGKRYFFLITHDDNLVFPPRIHYDYKKWKEKIMSLQYVANIYGLCSIKFREKINSLASEIDKAKKDFLKQYLGHHI